MSLTAIFSALKLPPEAARQAAPTVEVPREMFATVCADAVDVLALPLSLLFATDERQESGAFFVHAVFSVDKEKTRFTLRTKIPADDARYPSVTAKVMAAHWYERLIGDQFGITAEGHPDWRRLEHHQNIPAGTFPMRKDFAWNTKLAHADEPYPMHAVEGRGIYEIPVGPIHAGIIEPGHFRFNVRGERILTLEGKLFFKHKGVEKLLEGKTPTEAMPFIERVSGDMPIAHSLAFAQAVERIAGVDVPERAKYLRVFLNELERIAMHLFDIGNIAGNGTGFSFMAAQGFRLLEGVRRLNEALSGHRFLRGLVIPGGLSRDLTDKDLSDALAVLENTDADFQRVLDVAYGSDGLMERFETTGVLKLAAAVAYGAQGLPARASGVDRDARRDQPYAAYDRLTFSVPLERDGDVRARFDLRVKELKESLGMIRAVVKQIPSGPVSVAIPAKAGSALGNAESWRGEVLDWVRLDAEGRIDRCVVRDPSFCNWPLFGEIGPGNIVPDFPLCNKSLNLSYSGTDL